MTNVKCIKFSILSFASYPVTIIVTSTTVPLTLGNHIRPLMLNLFITAYPYMSGSLVIVVNKEVLVSNFMMSVNPLSHAPIASTL